MPQVEMTVRYTTETGVIDFQVSDGVAVPMALGVLLLAAIRIGQRGTPAAPHPTIPSAGGLSLLGSLAAALAGGAAKPPG